ncbi:hypothetical protein BC629DRAFT_1286526 [Irpex lacteus]|nr:hypothetical protein BC629DRAFT_1286526 [Irpex lacteus]
MKVASLAVLFAPLVTAQYFSDGWHPGQQVLSQTHTLSSPEFTPGAQPQPASSSPQTPPGNGGFVEALIHGPLNSLAEKVGINLTATYAMAQAAAAIWDERIPLVHDDNWESVVVDEALSEEEEKERVWFLVISAGSNQQGGISKIIDREFDAAYNETLIADDLPHVKWGRIDYMNVTYLTTKWNVWRAPFLVIAQDRGQSLRFFHATQTRLNSTILRNFLKNEGWRQTEPWSTSFAPGGNNEYILHYLALLLRKTYDLINPIPKFLLMIFTGAAGSLIMGLLHRPSKEVKAKEERERVVAEKAEAQKRIAAEKAKKEVGVPGTPEKKGNGGEVSTPSTPSSAKKGKGKKGGKK